MRGSENREKVYYFIQQYWKDNAVCPTVREICLKTEIKSTSTVHIIIHKLIDEGRLEDFEFGAFRKCTPVIVSSDNVKYCPFCGSVNCRRIETKEYRCTNCKSVFIVMKREG